MTRSARVGLLVLAGSLLFLIALFAIANRSFLFSDTFYVGAQFGRVSGLQTGAAVQYQGVNVGRVESVQLPTTPGGKITVMMAIREHARHLVRANTQAQIKTDGLVGNMIVVLVPTPQPAPAAAENEFIIGVDPFDVFEITDRALASVQTFEDAAITFQQIMTDVQQGDGTLGRIIYDPSLYNNFLQTTNETRRLMASLGNNAEALVGLAGQATEGVNGILAKIDRGEGTFARMLNDPAVYDALLAASDTMRAISTDLRAITLGAEHATNWAALGAFRFAELMEAGKHNFLFRRYFEDRGYVDRAPFEIRERAIEESHRRLQARERELQDWEDRLRVIEARIEAGQRTTTSTNQ
jgi:phospholipid/cholesterol/gamma-HCH transport system substrate-binding protein